MSDQMDNGLFDIPNYEHIEDESFPPLPPPFSPGQAGGDGDPFTNGEEDGEISRLAEVPAAKRRVKRPQPKLDSQRLTSERGLPALRTLFNNVHFKGKGHEAEDLRVLMQRMENWAHRLYPKLQFDHFIDKLETLGGKKDVQTCLKRIRLDMPLTHEDFIGKDGEEDEAVPRENRIQEDLDPFGDAGFPEEPQRLVHSTPAAPLLTEEQQRRIKLNKQLALERRQARMQQHSDSSQPMSLSMSAEEPSTSSTSHFHSQQNSGGVDDDDQRKSTADPSNSSRHKGSLLSPDSPLPERGERSPVPERGEGRHSPVPERGERRHSPVPERGERSPVPERGERSPVPERGERRHSPVPERGEHSPVPERGERSPVPERGERSPVPERGEGRHSPVPERGERSPVPERGERSPVPERGERRHSPVPERGERSPVPERGERSPVPERGERSPVPERGEGRHSPVPERGERSPVPERGEGSPVPERGERSPVPDSD